jgi:hypothetical protein
MPTQIFDHDSPSAPARALGMQLGARGVTLPALQTLGSLTAIGSGNADFSDINGYGQFAYDSAGRLYIADTDNNRIKRYVCTNGTWALDTIQTGILTLLGSGSSPCIVAIDRTVTPNQIHVAALGQNVDNTWINVWSVNDFGSFSTGNRIRRYGSNTNTSQAGKARFGSNLQLDGTHAIVSGASGSGRILCWNHQTGALVADVTTTPGVSQFATDGAGNWWATGDTDIRIRKYSPTTLSVLATLSAATLNQWKQDRAFSAGGGCVAYYNGTVLFRDAYGRIQVYDAATGLYKDTYGDPGSLEGSTWTGKHGAFQVANTPYRNKIGVVVDGDGCAWLAAWNYSGNTTSQSSFVTLQPLSTATATWTKTDWSSGTNTLVSLHVSGTELGAEKYKVRLRKNAGAWITFTCEDARNAANFASVGTFTEEDVLTVELSLSTHEEPAGGSSPGIREKLSPQNVFVQLDYSDSAAINSVPYPSSSARVRATAPGASRVRS